MKAYVYVSLKKSVLDPQGKTIQGAHARVEPSWSKYADIMLEPAVGHIQWKNFYRVDEARAARRVAHATAAELWCSRSVRSMAPR